MGGKVRAMAVTVLAVLMSGCATRDIIRADKCQWIKEKGCWNYTHYNKCNNPQHKEGGAGTCLQRCGEWVQDATDKILNEKPE